MREKKGRADQESASFEKREEAAPQEKADAVEENRSASRERELDSSINMPHYADTVEADCVQTTLTDDGMWAHGDIKSWDIGVHTKAVATKA